MSRETVKTRMDNNRKNEKLFSLKIVEIECIKDHGKMTKGTKYKVSESVASVLIDRKIAKDPKAKVQTETKTTTKKK